MKIASQMNISPSNLKHDFEFQFLLPTSRLQASVIQTLLDKPST